MRTLVSTIMALTLSASPVLAQRQSLTEVELILVKATAETLCESHKSWDEFEFNLKTRNYSRLIVLGLFGKQIDDSTNNDMNLKMEANDLMLEQLKECLDAKENNR